MSRPFKNFTKVIEGSQKFAIEYTHFVQIGQSKLQEESEVAHYRFGMLLLGGMLYWRAVIIHPTLTKFGLLPRNRWRVDPGSL
jgi:hypothetical protein